MVRFSEEGIPVDPEGQGRPKEDDALGSVAEASEPKGAVAPIVEAASAEVAIIAVQVPEVAIAVEVPEVATAVEVPEVATALEAPDVATTLEAPDEATALETPDEALGQGRT